MALVDLIGQYGIDANTSAGAGKQELGQDDFLNLLVIQLKNQDPLEPMKNEEFIAQLAQFNSLEQMINLNKSFDSMLALQSLSSASSFIGREVAWYGEDGEQMSGTVLEVELDSGIPLLNVEGQYLVDPSQIIAIGQA
jgi:flagellar basal-body rod modification protein FlgD